MHGAWSVLPGPVLVRVKNGTSTLSRPLRPLSQNLVYGRVGSGRSAKMVTISDATGSLEVANITSGAEAALVTELLETSDQLLLLVRQRNDGPDDAVYQLLWLRRPAQHDAANWKIKASADKK